MVGHVVCCLSCLGMVSGLFEGRLYKVYKWKVRERGDCSMHL